jgi:hypothetical protein
MSVIFHKYIYKEEHMLLYELFENDKEQLRKIQRINSKMRENPAVIDELWKIISTKVANNEGGLESRILTAVRPENTGVEQDQTYSPGFLEGLVDAIDKTEGTVEEKIAFSQTLGTADHIDTNALMQPLSGWSDWLVGSPFATRLFDTMFKYPAFLQDNKGPGEFALAILSPRIKLKGAKGDIDIAGVPVELKAGMTSSGGRLSPTKGTLGQLYGNKDFWSSLAPDDGVKGAELGKTNKINANNYSMFLDKNNLGPDQSTKILTTIFTSPGAQALATKIGNMGTNVTASELIKLAVKNYGDSQGDDKFLILQKDIRTSLFFDVDDLGPILSRISFSLPLIDSDARSQGQAQVGILKKAR